MRAVHVAVVGSVVGIVVACGGRGPLDDAVVVQSADASVSDAPEDVAPPVVDASPEAAPIETPVDAGQEGGIIQCGSCVIQQCGQTLLACVQDTSCRDIFQCVITTCAGSGGLDPKCLFGCASGDLGGLAQVFEVYQCLTATCGGACGDVLSGGLGGLGGSDGGP